MLLFFGYLQLLIFGLGSSGANGGFRVGAEKYLAANYETKGITQTLPSGLEFYSVGDPYKSRRSVLLVSDVWGWNSGRIRHIADMLGDAGYYAVIPKLMTPPLEGGTDGDGLYPHFDFQNYDDALKFGPYMEQLPWDGVIRPRVVSMTEHIHAMGMTHAAIFGFCW